MAAITIRDLRKRYGDVEALRGLDLDVGEGEVVAVLGPNGAGKTTTVEILEGYRRRDSGEVSVLGMDPQAADRAHRARIGVVLQSSAFDPFLTPRESLREFASWYDAPAPVDEVLQIVGLEDKADERVMSLSGGQQRRLDVALGLVGDPDLLFLDEPTTGFDPNARRQMWSAIRTLRSLGKTVLLTTHYMDEAQQLADRVAVVVGGLVVAEGRPADIGARTSTVIRFDLPAGLSAGDLPISPTSVNEAEVRVEVDDATEPLHRLTGWAIDRGVVLTALRVDRPSLEEAYLRLVAAHAPEEEAP